MTGVGGYMHAELARDLGFEAFRTWGGSSTPWALKAAATADALVVASQLHTGDPMGPCHAMPWQRAQAGLDMTREPKKYTGWENCNDMDHSEWWHSHANHILKVVRENKDSPRILWWIVPGIAANRASKQM